MVGLVLCAFAMVAAILAVGEPAGAQDEEACSAFFLANELEEAVTLYEVERRRELPRKIIEPGRSTYVSNRSSDGFEMLRHEEWLIRTSSNREVVYRKAAGDCPSTRITVGDGLSCDDVDFTSNPVEIEVKPHDHRRGTRVAINVERGDRRGPNFVFLGRHNINATTQTLSISIPPRVDSSEVEPWSVMARLIRPDGTRLDRIDCGIYVGTTEMPADVLDNVPYEYDEPGCFVFDKIARFSDGRPDEMRAAVTIFGIDEADWVFARSDTEFLGPITAEEQNYDPRITEVRVWGGPNEGSYRCVRDFAESDVFAPESRCGPYVDFTVLGVFPGSDGGEEIIWNTNTWGCFKPWDGTLRYSTATGENTGLGTPELTDCEGRYLKITLQTDPDGFYFNLRLVDSHTWEIVDFPDIGSSFPPIHGGFDCEGGFWTTQDGRVVRIDLEETFG